MSVVDEHTIVTRLTQHIINEAYRFFIQRKKTRPLCIIYCFHPSCDSEHPLCRNLLCPTLKADINKWLSSKDEKGNKTRNPLRLIRLVRLRLAQHEDAHTYAYHVTVEQGRHCIRRGEPYVVSNSMLDDAEFWTDREEGWTDVEEWEEFKHQPHICDKQNACKQQYKMHLTSSLTTSEVPIRLERAVQTVYREPIQQGTPPFWRHFEQFVQDTPALLKQLYAVIPTLKSDDKPGCSQYIIPLDAKQTEQAKFVAAMFSLGSDKPPFHMGVNIHSRPTSMEIWNDVKLNGDVICTHLQQFAQSLPSFTDQLKTGWRTFESQYQLFEQWPPEEKDSYYHQTHASYARLTGESWFNRQVWARATPMASNEARIWSVVCGTRYPVHFFAHEAKTERTPQMHTLVIFFNK